jgi:hypothetical protein
MFTPDPNFFHPGWIPDPESKCQAGGSSGSCRYFDYHHLVLYRTSLGSQCGSNRLQPLKHCSEKLFAANNLQNFLLRGK